MSPMIRAASLRGFAPLVEELGGDPDGLLERFALSGESIDHDDDLIPIEAHDRMLDTAAAELDCPDLGLFVHSPALRVDVEPDPYDRRGVVALTYWKDLRESSYSRQGIELGLGLFFRIAVLLVGGRVGVRSIEIPHRALFGVWVSSENVISPDNWQPELSRIPGVRKYHEKFGREICPNANTLDDSLDQYDSIIEEKTLAASCKADPSKADRRWLQILPSSELAPRKRQWPVVPTYVHGGIEYGEIEAGLR